MKKLLTVLLLSVPFIMGASNQPPYLNTDLSVDDRVEDLVSRMTVEEKISQLSHLAPAIERLHVKAYEPNFDNPYGQLSIAFSEEDADEVRKNRPWEDLDTDDICMDGGYWNEALHGVARSGLATAFPQCIGLGATWNPELIESMANAIGIEARVHNNVYGKKLTYWSPTINILRDPRWGRNEESYSEDPCLLSRMAVAFVSGLQGDDPNYLQAVATVKHFVANNSEYNRHDGSSDVSERLLREYYFPAFKAAITEAGAMSVMSAYNAVNGIPASANKWLLTDILRNEWGFKGYVVSDCGAISDVIYAHKYETDKEKAVAATVKAGTELECETCGAEPLLYDEYLPGALEKGYITEADIDTAVKRIFRARMLLGEFDPPESVPYTKIPESMLDCQAHRELALQTARESIVLLKNDGALPLNKEEIESIAVIGPNANVAVLGGYSSDPAIRISPRDGIENYVGSNIEVVYHKGCNITNEPIGEEDHDEHGIRDEERSIEEAAALAKDADVAVLVVGTNLSVADEEADRKDLNLPGNQLKLVQEVYKANPNTIVVLVNGMSLSINWIDENVPAIVEAWYPGQSGGTAIAEVLFGEYNPGGKLPVTFHKTADDLPHIGEYDITKGHSYWYFKGDVLYPFGYGLSYTTFAFKDLEISRNKINVDGENQLTVDVTVQNTGGMKGDEVVQLYIKDLESSVVQPQKRLRKFKRISLDEGESKTVSFTLGNADFSYWDGKIKDWIIEAGDFEIQIGNSSTDIKLREIVTASD